MTKRAFARMPAVGRLLRFFAETRPEPVAKLERQPAPIESPELEPVLVPATGPDPDFVRSLGYEFESSPISRIHGDAPLPPPPWPAHDLYFATVCSVNHVPFTRTLVESIARHHPDIPCVVAVVDASSRDEVGIEGAIVLTGRDVFGPDLDYAALKFHAFELCCAAKPFTIEYLLRHSPARRFIYVDSDIYIFGAFDAMIAALGRADFVVTPHTMAPIPAPERWWEKPSLGDLEDAGVMNAGMFGMRRSEDSAEFIANWKWQVITPGGYYGSRRGQAEQHAFNWVTCFARSVEVFRDTAYNVAYWNLHDRSLRYVAEERGEGHWTVDGKPLVAFHFSGFSLADPYRLSKHENRYQLYSLPAVARLCESYVSCVRANDRGELGGRYGFDHFPSGIGIDARMREIFRSHEVFLRRDLSPWTEEGEAYYARALLSPVPYTSSLAPILMKAIADSREDLRVLGDVSLDPTPLVNWMLTGGMYEHGYEALIDRHRPVVPTYSGAVLLSQLHRQWPERFDGVEGAVRQGRNELVARLADVAPAVAKQIRAGATEHYIVSSIGLIRQFVSQRPDLLGAFPDLLFSDAPAFVQWLRDRQLDEHFLPTWAIDTFAARAGGGSLARLFSYVSRTWELMERRPLALLGEDAEEFTIDLLWRLRHTIEYDLEDLEMFRWIAGTTPWVGLPLTLELPIHTTQHPSSRSRQGQDEILARVLEDSRFARALEQYREQYPPVEDRAPRARRTPADVSAFWHVSHPSRRGKDQPAAPVAPGVNLFGYHRSDVGLGQMSRGLLQSLELTGCRTSAVVLGNIRMDADLRPKDFIRNYDPEKGTNIFVSYPHFPDSLLRSVPDDLVERHRNIAYLAWEQRDGSHYWKDVYAAYDQVWALSDFAAESLTAILERPVHSVPCVVDTSVFPEPSAKERHGLDPSRFTFLFIFDANSSTERKNPEAVVKAFRAAFRDDDAVHLVIKASSGSHIGNRARLQRLLSTIGSDPRIEVRVQDLRRNDLYGLISASDCYVSLHRGEGFGYTCAEAMVYGKPVIATGYSGNMQFMSEANSYPVRYREVEADVQEGPFQRGSLWAEPDLEHASELMRLVYEYPQDASAKGARGAETIRLQYSPAAIASRVAALIPDACLMTTAAL